MKVRLFNTLDQRGGAAKAALRLTRALRKLSVDAELCVAQKDGGEAFVHGPATRKQKVLFRLGQFLDDWPMRSYARKKSASFSVGRRSGYSMPETSGHDVDLIHLHWINSGMLSISDIASTGKPLVWTFHDSWPFTGGCHVPGDCDAYTRSCGQCPVLQSQRHNDLSRKIHSLKMNTLRKLDFSIATPSHWMAACIRASSIFAGREVHVVPNGVDVELFKPVDRQHARDILGVPADKFVVLMGAEHIDRDDNKGFHWLVETLVSLPEPERKNIHLLIFGMSEPAQRPNTGTSQQYLGRLHDEFSLVLAYAAADITAVPSRQESFGFTALESMSCGTPVLAFNATGLKDIVLQRQTGYLAEPYSVADLQTGLLWLMDEHQRQATGLAARERAVSLFSMSQVAQQYIHIYNGELKNG